MTEVVRDQVRTERTDGVAGTGNTINHAQTTVVAHTDGQSLAAKIVWYIVGLLNTLLVIRFVLSLLGANTANAFASFIYNITYPFVAPFFGLFNYNVHYGVSTVELYTLLAVVIYSLVGYAIVRLITLNRTDIEV